MSKVIKCCALNCNNSSKKGYIMKPFPRNVVRRAQWIANIGRKRWQPTTTSYLCEVHFEPGMWEKKVDGYAKLKRYAAPTIFESHLKKRKNAKKGSNTDNLNKKQLNLSDVDQLQPKIKDVQIYDLQYEVKEKHIHDIQNKGKDEQIHDLQPELDDVQIYDLQYKVKDAQNHYLQTKLDNVQNHCLQSKSNTNGTSLSQDYSTGTISLSNSPNIEFLEPREQNKNGGKKERMTIGKNGRSQGAIDTTEIRKRTINQNRLKNPGLSDMQGNSDQPEKRPTQVNTLEIQKSQLKSCTDRLCKINLQSMLQDVIYKQTKEIKRLKIELGKLRDNNIILKRERDRQTRISEYNSRFYKTQLKRAFTIDQIKALLSNSNKPPYRWSAETILEAVLLKRAYGDRGYQELLKQNIPLPSLQIIHMILQ